MIRKVYNTQEVDPDSLWDRYVPIMTTQKPDGTLESVVHIIDVIAEPRQYTELVSLLRAAQEGDTVIFNLNTPGGALDTTLMICDAIENTEATVKGRVTGSVASAGTILVMSMDELEVANFGSMMIHNYSGGVFGKGHEIEAQTKFEIPFLKKFFHETYKTFLNKDERNAVIGGHDHYMAEDEIIERWGKLQARRDKLIGQFMEAQNKAQIAATVEFIEAQGYIVDKPEDK